jgi:hypothetical protein
MEDRGETEGEGDGGGEAKIAHTALDDEVGTEFREKMLAEELGQAQHWGRGERPSEMGCIWRCRMGMAAGMVRC